MPSRSHSRREGPSSGRRPSRPIRRRRPCRETGWCPACSADRTHRLCAASATPRGRPCVASGVRFVIRSSVNRCRVNGGGSVGSTCDGDELLPFDTWTAGAGLAPSERAAAPFRDRGRKPAVLRRLRDDVALPAVVANGDERRRRGKITIPDVVFDTLEVPHAFAGRRTEAEDRVCKQVVAEPVGAVEIVRRRAGRGVDETPRLVERHTRPGVGAAACISRPRRATCRSRARPDAGWYGTTTSAGRC